MGDVGVGGGRGEAPGDPANEGQEGKILEAGEVWRVRGVSAGGMIEAGG